MIALEIGGIAPGNGEAWRIFQAIVLYAGLCLLWIQLWPHVAEEKWALSFLQLLADCSLREGVV